MAELPKNLDIPCPLILTLEQALLLHASLRATLEMTHDERLRELDGKMVEKIDLVMLAHAVAKADGD